MRISEVKLSDIKKYARIYDDDEDALIADIIKPSAIRHIVGYTGLAEADLEAHEDITIAFFALCSFLYDNRSMVIQSDKINSVMDGLLSKHRVNLL